MVLDMKEVYIVVADVTVLVVTDASLQPHGNVSATGIESSV